MKPLMPLRSQESRVRSRKARYPFGHAGRQADRQVSFTEDEHLGEFPLGLHLLSELCLLV